MLERSSEYPQIVVASPKCGPIMRGGENNTEGDKVKMSQRKTLNAKHKTQKQPHVAPHPINFF